jgi:cupin 2 domain-containing protein
MLPGELKDLFENLPADLGAEQFSELVRAENVRIERIVSRGHSSPPTGWYDQPENEWVAVLKGEARLGFENGSEIHLTAGSHVTIPAHTKHRVVWTLPDTDTIWLAVHYR